MNLSTSGNTYPCLQNQHNILVHKSIGKILLLFFIALTLMPHVYAQACTVTTSSTHTNVSCYGTATGSIDLTVSGGTAPYTYSWIGAAGGVIPAGQANNQDLTALVAGIYRVTVTDANACSVITAVFITQAAQALTATYVQVNPGCDSVGTVNLTVFGGVAPYSYVWTATNGGVVPAGQQNGQDMYNVIPGTYTVVLTDAAGCSLTKTAVLTQSSAPLVATSTQTNVGCSGDPTGSIDLAVTGGRPPYTYSWTASNGGSIPAGQSTGEDLSGLSAGIYSVLVTSSNGGCVTTKNILITTGKLNITYTQINQTCGASGSIHVNVNGGTPGAGYTYLWTAANGGVVPAGQALNKDLDHLVAGTYTLTVTDAIGCTGAITVTITQSSSGISIAATPTNVACFGGSTGAINVSVNGGSGQYTYQWFAFFGGQIPAGQATNEDLTGLKAGVYTVFITDGYCSGHKTLIVTQPLPLILTGFASNLHSCNASNAAINLIVVGGSSPYTYVWTASNGGSIPAGQANNQDLTGLRAGNYKVVVTDSRGCTSTKTFQVNCPRHGHGCHNKNSDNNDGHDRIDASDDDVITLSTYPNPINSYTDKITFKIRSSVSGQATLELYDILGTKLAVPFNGYIDMKTDKIIIYTLPANNKGTLIYRFRIGDKTISGKVLSLN